MASVKDIATMESIRSIVEACTVSKIRPEIILSNGVPLLQKSINAVRNAGVWATDIALIGFIVSFFIIVNGTDEIGVRTAIIVIIYCTIHCEKREIVLKYNRWPKRKK